MGIREDDAVGGRQAGEIVAALDKLVRAFAVGGSVLRDRLIEPIKGPPPLWPNSTTLLMPGWRAQKFDAGFHVERQLLESTSASLFLKRVFMHSTIKPRRDSSVQAGWRR